MPSHAIYMGGSWLPCVIQPASHTWRPSRGETKWRVREVPDGYVASRFENPDKYPTVDLYNPAKVDRPKVQTPYKGSWAEDMANRKTTL